MYLNHKQLKTFADTIGASTGEDGLLYVYAGLGG
jgi:hypothetical protein